MDDTPIVTGKTHDQGDSASQPGECYLLSAAWMERGGRVGGSAAVGVFPDLDAALDTFMGSVASSIGRRRVVALLRAKQLDASHRVLEPDDLEEMAALVRQHRAAQAAGE